MKTKFTLITTIEDYSCCNSQCNHDVDVVISILLTKEELFDELVEALDLDDEESDELFSVMDKIIDVGVVKKMSKCYCSVVCIIKDSADKFVVSCPLDQAKYKTVKDFI